MKSHLFLAIATGLVSTVAAKTVSTTITTCDCTTSTTATPLWNNITSLETIVTTSTTTHSVTEVFTPETQVTLYTNATSISCDPASTVYETKTPTSTIVVTITTQPPTTLPTVPVLTPPYAAGNVSTPCASSGMPAGPSGWPNPHHSSSSVRTPLGTSTPSTMTKTSTLATPTHTMWEGSGQRLAPPRLFILLAKVFSLAAPVRGQIANIMNDPEGHFQPYPDQYHESITTGIGASTELSPLPDITPSSVTAVAPSSVESAPSDTQGVVSFPPLASSSFWDTSSVVTTITKTLVSETFTSNLTSGLSPSSEVDVTITFTTFNCSSSTAAAQTFSNTTIVSTSVVYASSTVTQLTTATPTLQTPDATTRSHNASTTAMTMSMHFHGGAASLQVLPGWLAGLVMLMIL